MTYLKYDRFSHNNDFYKKKKENKQLYKHIGRKRDFNHSKYGDYLIQRQAKFTNGYIGTLYTKSIRGDTPLHMVLVHKAVLIFKTLKFQKELEIYRKEKRKIPISSDIYKLQNPRV